MSGRRQAHGRLRAGTALAALIGIALAAASHGAAAPGRARVPAAKFATILPPAPGVKTAAVPAFDMDRTPVTNQDFARFVATHPQWRRDRVARVFADPGYLLHWPRPTGSAPGAASQPVTHVSWFAANAYCEVQGARLPTWHEWELVGAAGTDVADARARPEWRQQVLAWYARPASAPLPEVGRGVPNFYGVQDVHGVVWEWVLDLGSMMVSADNREQGDPDAQRFCGSGAVTMEQKENYAMLMRIATLSSMQASYTSSSMGFRCVADVGVAP
jgi:formylglycine-generating enzyme